MCGTGQSKFDNEDAYKEHRAKRNSPFMVYTRTKLDTKHVGDLEIQGAKTVSFNKTTQFSKVNLPHFNNFLVKNGYKRQTNFLLPKSDRYGWK